MIFFKKINIKKYYVFLKNIKIIKNKSFIKKIIKQKYLWKNKKKNLEISATLKHISSIPFTIPTVNHFYNSKVKKNKIHKFSNQNWFSNRKKKIKPRMWFKKQNVNFKWIKKFKSKESFLKKWITEIQKKKNKSITLERKNQNFKTVTQNFLGQRSWSMFRRSIHWERLCLRLPYSKRHDKTADRINYKNQPLILFFRRLSRQQKRLFNYKSTLGIGWLVFPKLKFKINKYWSSWKFWQFWYNEVPSKELVSLRIFKKNKKSTIKTVKSKQGFKPLAPQLWLTIKENWYQRRKNNTGYQVHWIKRRRSRRRGWRGSKIIRRHRKIKAFSTYLRMQKWYIWFFSGNTRQREWIFQKLRELGLHGIRHLQRNAWQPIEHLRHLGYKNEGIRGVIRRWTRVKNTRVSRWFRLKQFSKKIKFWKKNFFFKYNSNFEKKNNKTKTFIKRVRIFYKIPTKFKHLKKINFIKRKTNKKKFKNVLKFYFKNKITNQERIITNYKKKKYIKPPKRWPLTQRQRVLKLRKKEKEIKENLIKKWIENKKDIPVIPTALETPRNMKLPKTPVFCIKTKRQKIRRIKKINFFSSNEIKPLTAYETYGEISWDKQLDWYWGFGTSRKRFQPKKQWRKPYKKFFPIYYKVNQGYFWKRRIGIHDVNYWSYIKLKKYKKFFFFQKKKKYKKILNYIFKFYIKKKMYKNVWRIRQYWGRKLFKLCFAGVR